MRTALLALAVLLTGCPKKDEPSPPAAPKAPPAQPQPVGGNFDKAECEFFGTIDPGALKPAKLWFTVLEQPCSPLPAEVTALGQTEVQGDRLFAEFYIPQGKKGHICLFGLDADGKVIGWAGTDRNPATFEGKGEVIFDKLALKLEALPAPAPKPKGL